MPYALGNRTARQLGRTAFALLLAAGADGCIGGDERGSQSTFGAGYRIAPTSEVVRIGALSSPTQALTAIPSAVLDGDGNVYLAQPLDGHVKVFSEHGELRSVIGRPGSGPGELSRPSVIGLVRDSLWVLDGGRRVTVFSRKGDYARTVATPRIASADSSVHVTAAVPMRNGNYLGIPTLVPDSSHNFIVEYPVLDADLSPANVLTSLQYNARDFIIVRLPIGVLHTSQPFRDEPLIALDPTGDGVWVVERRADDGRPDIVMVRHYRAAGDTVSKAVQVPVIEVDDRAMAARLVEVFGPTDSAANRPFAVSEIRSRIWQPARISAVGRLAPTMDGDVWLEVTVPEDTVGVWLQVFGERVVQLAVGAEILAGLGNRLLVEERDTLDVPYAVLLRLGNT